MPSYLAPYFDHDVFMSYAHGRLPGEAYAPLRSWSQKFIDLLRADIYALQPELSAVRFWDDRNVDPTAALTQDIKEKVERSGVLLIMMSPRYLASDWCKNELHWFKVQFEGRHRSPGRVFVVRAVSTNTDLWPDFLKDESGHRVSVLPGNHRRRCRTLRLAGTARADTRVQSAVLEAAYDVDQAAQGNQGRAAAHFTHSIRATRTATAATLISSRPYWCRGCSNRGRKRVAQ
jgi:hypothetical protein